MPFARPVSPPSAPAPPPRLHEPVLTDLYTRRQVPNTRSGSENEGGNNAGTATPVSTSDAIPTVTTVQVAADMEARNGRPARPVTLGDYSFLQERHEEDAESAYPVAAHPIPRTASEVPIVTTAPVPIAAPVPNIIPAATSLATTTSPRGRTNTESSPLEPTFCLCRGWRVPGWLSSCFANE